MNDKSGEHGVVVQRPALSIDRVGLVLGPLAMLAWLLLVDTSATLNPEAHRLAGVMLLTVIWWLTEPIPISATALAALVLCVFCGAVPADDRGPAWVALAGFGNPSLFFLVGGMFIGQAMMRHGLDRRMALSILATRWAGHSPGTILLAVGLVVGMVSMFISNTAATAMLYPVTMGIIAVLSTASGKDPRAFARSPYATMLLLMTAYGSSVGGVATPIGTTTNVVAMGFFERPEFGARSVDFARWAFAGLPLTITVFIALYFWLRLLAGSPGLEMDTLRKYLQVERRKLGAWSAGEANTLAVFITVVALWFAPSVLALIATPEMQKEYSNRFPEEMVALLAPVLLFLLPVDWKRRRFSLDSSDLAKIDWGTMILFGAGLSLGGLMFKTGLAEAVGQAGFTMLGTDNVWAITALAIAAGIVLSDLTSNTATATTLFPVVWSLCTSARVDVVPPLMGLVMAASFGSALPVSTPPNAIVYGSGIIPVRRMILAGVGLDIIAGVVIWCVLRVAFALGWSPFLTT